MSGRDEYVETKYDKEGNLVKDELYSGDELINWHKYQTDDEGRVVEAEFGSRAGNSSTTTYTYGKKKIKVVIIMKMKEIKMKKILIKIIISIKIIIQMKMLIIQKILKMMKKIIKKMK